MLLPTNHLHKLSSRRWRLFPWFICGLGALFYCYEYLLRITPSVMTSQLMQSFHINAAQLGLLSAFYYYAYNPMQFPVGMLMDKYGPRRLLTLACVVCAIGAFLFSGNNFYVAAFARFLIGFGSAFAFVGVLKLATIWLPAERFGMVAGLVTGIGMIGAMFGDNLLNYLTVHLGTRLTLIYIAGAGLLLAVILWLGIKPHPGTDKKIKKHESTMSVPALFSGLWLILKKPQLWINGIIGCCFFLPVTALAELWGISFLQQAHHLDSVQASAAGSCIFLGFAFGGSIIGALSDYFRTRRLPLVIGGALTTLVAFVMIMGSNFPYFVIILLMFFLGFFAGAEVIIFAVARENCPENLSGSALAFTNFFTMLGGAVFQPVIGYLLDLHANPGGISKLIYTANDYRTALLVVPISLLIGTILALFIKETIA